jgi:hypothetical protein
MREGQGECDITVACVRDRVSVTLHCIHEGQGEHGTNSSVCEGQGE